MKIRTKLVLLLSTALVVTMVTATWLRIGWMRQRLVAQVDAQAEVTAADIASDLAQRIKEDTSEKEIFERLRVLWRRHPSVARVECVFEGDEETTVSFSLNFTDEDPRIKRTARPPQKQRPFVQRRDEARRSLYDHGASTRRPGERLVEPLWRTPDRADSTRWSRLAPRALPPARRPTVISVGGEEEEKGYLKKRVTIDPEGTRRGQLTLAVELEPIDRLIRTEKVASAVVFSAAVLLLMALSALIVDRVVGKPVEELERAMREVEKGDLSRRVAEVRDDEIGALSRGFNAMLGRLAEANEEIRAFNRRLADEVRAATIDLARKNETLAQLNRLLFETRRELGDKERLAALGQLAAQLAHEMGTPLSSVSGHLQLALHARDLQQPIKDRLLVATRELERVSRIVRDYLDSTRPVAPAQVNCDLGRVVDEAIGVARGVQVATRIEKQVEPGAARVVTDPGLVRQILVNLLTNAIDATSASGSGGRIQVAVAARTGLVELSVTDDGAGIRPEDAARIFEPFYTTKGRGKGTGLGLSICRELASALGGRISVTSTPGEGSTFTLLLPRDWSGAHGLVVRAPENPEKAPKTRDA